MTARVLQHKRMQFCASDALAVGARLKAEDAFGARPLQRAALCFMHVPQHRPYADILLGVLLVEYVMCALNEAAEDSDVASMPQPLRTPTRPARASRFAPIAPGVMPSPSVSRRPPGTPSRLPSDLFIRGVLFQRAAASLDAGSLQERGSAEAAVTLMIILLIDDGGVRTGGPGCRSCATAHSIGLVHSYCQLALCKELRTEGLRRAVHAVQLPNGGHTLLTAAASVGAHWLITMLLSSCEDAEAASPLELCLSDGSSALHLAAQNRHFEACVQLLAFGADLMATNSDGISALDLVPMKERGRFEELRYLGALGYAAFVSHMKAEGQTEARSLKEAIEQRLKRRVFLE